MGKAIVLLSAALLALLVFSGLAHAVDKPVVFHPDDVLAFGAPLIDGAGVIEDGPVVANVLAPAIGTRRIIALLVQFPSERNHSLSDCGGECTPSFFENLLFGAGNASVRNYFYENSLSQLALTGVVTNWLDLSHSMSYYGYDYGGSIDYGQGPNYGPCDLLLDAVAVADSLIDFSSCNTSSDCTVMVVHAGYGQESSATSSLIWSSSWTTGDAFCPSPIADGNIITGAIFVPEAEAGGQSILGVAAHEYAHALGAPDLYNTATGGSVVYDWDLMDRGSWSGSPYGSKPAALSAWQKVLLGWVMPETVSYGASKDFVLNALSSLQNSSKVLKIPVLGPDQEYFLVENRQASTGYFDSSIPESGVVVWHVNDAIGSIGSNNVNNGALKRVAVENQNPAVAGLASAAFSAGQEFTPSSSPNSAAQNGSASGIRVWKLVAVDSAGYAVSVDNNDSVAPIVSVMLPLNSSVFSSRNGIELNYSTYEVLDVFQAWYSVDSRANVSLNSNSSFNVSSDGIHYLIVYANDSAGNLGVSPNITFTVDSVAPSLIVSSPSNASNYSAVPMLSFQAFDERLNATWFVLNCVANYSGGNASALSVVNGWNSLEVYANDSAGNVNSSGEILFFFNNSEFLVSVSSPLNGSVHNSSVWLNYSVSDAGGVAWYSLNGANASLHGNAPILPTQGWNPLFVYANDSAGSENNSQEITFYYDGAAPYLDYLTEANASGYYNSLQTVAFVASDEGGVDRIELYVNGTLNVTCAAANCSITFSNDGDYGVYAIAFDSIASNSNSSATRDYSLNFSSPVVSNAVVTASSSGAVIYLTADKPVSVTVFYGTNASELSSTASNSSYSVNQSITLSGLSASVSYYYVVRSCDLHGNCVNSSVTSFATSAAASSYAYPSGGGGSGGGGGSSSSGVAPTPAKTADEPVQEQVAPQFAQGVLLPTDVLVSVAPGLKQEVVSLLSPKELSELGITSLEASKIQVSQVGEVTFNTVDARVEDVEQALRLVRQIGVKNELVALMRSMQAQSTQSIQVTTSLAVYRLANPETGVAIDRTLVTLSFIAPNGLARIIQVVPKSIAASASELVFLGLQPTVLEDDPVLEWIVENKSGTRVQIAYVLKKRISLLESALTIGVVPRSTQLQTPPTTAVPVRGASAEYLPRTVAAASLVTQAEPRPVPALVVLLVLSASACLVFAARKSPFFKKRLRGLKTGLKKQKTNES